MKRWIRQIYYTLMYKLKILKNKNGLKFHSQYSKFKTLNSTYNRFEKLELMPIFGEDTVNTNFDKHYLYHTSWAVRKLKEINPSEHIDISSSLYFAGAASAFCPIKYYDYRPPALLLDNLTIGTCNLTNMHFATESIESLSCMHVVEHIGLGRYGDPIDYDGDIKAINELKRVLKRGGKLIFVVPIGATQKICFNAHRVYKLEQIKQYFNDFNLLEFTFITSKFDKTGLILNPSNDVIANEMFGCGCFLFMKK